jgi:hypothetical protein
VLLFQWRAYWRRVQRAGRINASNLGIFVLLGGIGIVKYLQQLPAIAGQLPQGNTTKYEMLLAAAFMVWLLPAMAESRRSISSRALLHFPFATRELFFLRLTSVFISPVTWIIVICSLALGYPLTSAPNRAAGMAALSLFLLLALAVSLTTADLLSTFKMKKLLLGGAVASAGAYGLHRLVRGRALPSDFTLWPNRLAANAAVSSQPVRSIAVLFGITVVAFGLSLWAFTRSLQPRDYRRSQRFTVLGVIEFPGRFGGLLRKDLRDFGRLLDLYVVLPIVILFSIYLASTPAPSVTAFGIIPVILFFPASTVGFNCLGLESPLGLDRYTLLPLTGRDILLSKNLAVAVMLIASFSITLPLSLWRFGAGITALGFIELVVVGLAYFSWGNWMSVKQPFKMQFYRFSSGGSAVDLVLGVIFGSLPGFLTIYLLSKQSYGALWAIILMMLLYLALYYFSVTWSGRRLEQRREAIRGVLS